MIANVSFKSLKEAVDKGERLWTGGKNKNYVYICVYSFEYYSTKFLYLYSWENSADIVQEKEIIEKSMANDNITVEENYTKKR